MRALRSHAAAWPLLEPPDPIAARPFYEASSGGIAMRRLAPPVPAATAAPGGEGGARGGPGGERPAKRRKIKGGAARASAGRRHALYLPPPLDLATAEESALLRPSFAPSLPVLDSVRPLR
eukprot:tig00000269_g23759.t1